MNVETARYTIWLDALLGLVGCQYDEYAPHRAMVMRWYWAGESPELAASGLRLLVRSATLPNDDGIGCIRAARTVRQ